MGQAKRRGTLDDRKSQSEFYANEQERLDKWFYDNRPVVVSVNSHGGISRRRRTASLQRALLISALCGMGAFVTDKDGNRIS